MWIKKVMLIKRVMLIKKLMLIKKSCTRFNDFQNFENVILKKFKVLILTLKKCKVTMLKF